MTAQVTGYENNNNQQEDLYVSRVGRGTDHSVGPADEHFRWHKVCTHHTGCAHLHQGGVEVSLLAPIAYLFVSLLVCACVLVFKTEIIV